MYFQKGKQKGNPTFQVVDLGSGRSSQFYVSSAIELSEARQNDRSTCEESETKDSNMSIDNSFLDYDSEYDSENELRNAQTYKK